MNTAEFLRSPHMREAIRAYQERHATYRNDVLATDTGVAERGDIRTICDPRDDTDIRLLGVLNVSAGVALCCLTTTEEVFGAHSDILVKGHSAHSSVPYDLVLDGIFHFNLPVTALGGLIGRVSEDAVQALLVSDFSDLNTDGVRWHFPIISGPLDIRWKHKQLQRSLMRALAQHHRPTEGPPPARHST